MNDREPDIFIDEQLSPRDHFALAALTGTFARCHIREDDLKEMAKDCYRIADAMCEARKDADDLPR